MFQAIQAFPQGGPTAFRLGGVITGPGGGGQGLDDLAQTSVVAFKQVGTAFVGRRQSHGKASIKN
jgi:hypothetical protein